jgi:MYXO-CTERM domain-containing protein
MIRVFLGSLVVFTTLSTSASADIKLDLRVGPPQPAIEPAALSGHTIFLNRCAGPDGIPGNADGGCPVNPGNDDATANPPTSGVPSSPSVLSEYTDFAAGEWEATVQCVKEVYSPFDVKIVDTKPPAGTQYSMIMVGGSGSEVGSPGSGGVAIVSGNCAPIVKGVSYAFTDQIDIFAQEIGGSRPLGLCWIIAQETAHSFGLDHEFAFLDDMRSACNDPMTYRDDCGGQKFYRNKFASCGEFEQQGPRQCRCGANQNSHLMLLNIFGGGTSLIGPPEVAVTTPAVSSTAANSLPANIIASAGSKRGVNRVELYLNGFKWAEVNGAPFGRQGQMNPSAYGLLPPPNLPDSIYDIEVRAFDDLEIVGTSPIITVTKGAAGGCVSADTCALGQKCEAGKCFWDPPSGVVGDSCDFPEFCLSGKCEGTADEKICTQNCIPGVADSCPMGLTCLENGNNDICFLPSDEGGGCCSTSNGTTPWAPFGFAGVVLGFVLMRRRRR